MPQLCPNCNTEIAEGKKFCPNCGTKIEAPPQFPDPDKTTPAGQFVIPPVQPPTPVQPQPQPQAQFQPQPQFQSQPPQTPLPYQAAPAYAPPQPVSPPPPRNSPYAPIGMLGYLGWLILMCIPVIGWIMTVVLSFTGTNANRKNLARAMLVLTIVGIGIAATTLILYWTFLNDLMELIKNNFEITFGF